ncbi:Proteasome assembly chaperone 2 [Desmophyllum pertusum]|uniref:Proteasome assembly chaperone 2 n=1 Tax=Desmophyllum pertusum TaxID=174260 RepID=A0A9W9ZMF1_9CNID|nr:Proteasome assembly chaperone 2 [Desmophyllum pertusum]
MFVASGKDVSVNWSEFTLILPAVSIGNVGQLAVDLVVSSISPNGCHIGYFYDSCILPLVGNDAFTQSTESLGKLNVSVEVYKNDDLKFVVVQQRAPLVKGCQTEYCRKLVTWIKSCNFKQVILVSSISATERVDSQIGGSPLRYVVTPAAKNLLPLFDGLSWKTLEKRPKFPHATEESSNENRDLFLPGGGFTKKLYEACCRDDIPLAVLLTFCCEGDNISDAVNLFLYINDWLKMVPRTEVEAKVLGKASSFVFPASWCSMFGSPVHPDGNLF